MTIAAVGPHRAHRTDTHEPKGPSRTTQRAAAPTQQGKVGNRDPEQPLEGGKPTFGVFAAGPAAPPACGSVAVQQRVEQARQAITALAQQLPGHGVDVQQLAQRYASSQYAAMTPAQVRQDAGTALVRAAITAHPELADKAVALRLQGLSPAHQGTVREALAQDGSTGLNKVAAADAALRALRGFKPEELDDIRNMMRTGMRFDQAVATERAELARPAASVQGAQQARWSQGGTAAQVQQVRTLAGSVQAMHRGLPVVTRGAELIVGAGATLATGGQMVGAGAVTNATRDLQHVAKAMDNAQFAIKLVAGDLTDRIALAKDQYHAFSKAYAEYETLHRQVEQAWNGHDYKQANALAARMNALATQMKNVASSLAPLAGKVGEMDKRFDATAHHTAVHAAAAAASLGLSPPAVGTSAAHAAKESWHAVAHFAAETAVTQGISLAMEH
jgi:hypothetical protein